MTMSAVVESLVEIESRMEGRRKGFFADLMLIRDTRQYRETYDTFEAYCRERWGIGRRTANREIEAVTIVGSLGSIDPKPENVGQTRELAKVEPERRQEVWERVVEEAPVVNGKPKITARLVAEVATEEVEPTGYLSDEQRWVAKLQQLYRRAPTEAQVRFRKWVATA